MTFSEECAGYSPAPSTDAFSVASVIWRVTDDADFKLAATGSTAIEIKWLGERLVAAGPGTVSGTEIDWDEWFLLDYEESRLLAGSAAGYPTEAPISPGWAKFLAAFPIY